MYRVIGNGNVMDDSYECVSATLLRALQGCLESLLECLDVILVGGIDPLYGLAQSVRDLPNIVLRALVVNEGDRAALATETAGTT